MTTTSFFARPPVALQAGMLAVAAAFPAPGRAATAAVVEFVSNSDVIAVAKATGKSRVLTKGATVESGDRIFTRSGRAQLRFTDQAYVSLQDQSEFSIDDYQFNGKADGSERGFFSLLKGGLRTITGLVGRTNKKNYQVTTTVATIGIRGTEYTIKYTGSITGSVGEGEVDVCNSKACVAFGSGQSFHVSAPDSRPVLTYQKTDLPPKQPTEPTPSFVSGDQTGSDGLPSIFIFTGTQSLSVVSVDDGTTPNSPVNGEQVIFDGNGTVQKIGGNTLYSVKMGGNNGVIAWGTGLLSPSSAEVTHFVAGLQTPQSDFIALQAGNAVLKYTQIGGTDITGNFGSGRVTGARPDMDLTLRTGVMKADISASGSFSAGGQVIAYSAKASDIAINTTTGTGTAFFFGTNTFGGVCTFGGGVSCSGSFALLFAGRNAANAGAVLGMSGSTGAGSGEIAGSVAFAVQK